MVFAPKKSEDEPEEEEEENEYADEKERRKPFFNDAGPTLERIGMVLKEYMIFNYVYPVDNAEKQRAKIEWLKKFFIMSVSVLVKCMKEKEFKKCQEKVFNLKIKRKLKVKNGIQKIHEIYDERLNEELDNIITSLQVKISPFLMPERTDEDEGL